MSPQGDDLGDIDAIGINLGRRMIFIVEAKDFEMARNPSELANEADALLRGDKSAAFKIARLQSTAKGQFRAPRGRSPQVTDPANHQEIKKAAASAERALPCPGSSACSFGEPYSPPSYIPCTAGIVPNRPFWKSSNAC
ncbi:hypothetical protein GCM10010412_075910 [Nonomuraea recticatena]|uniref:Uncharacterized protein n=1 Tax=Nonomuraea recticatena TaxID=46178 RepID=A0ABN3SYP4_9ACTN